MKKTRYIKPVMYIVLVCAIAAVAAWLIYNLKETTHVEIGSSGKIDVTPQQVTEIKQIGEWEFLKVSDEEVIDTIRKRAILADDRLVKIYYGTVRIGIDLNKAADDWVVNNNDTLTVTLPVPGLLDDRFIDEARTVTFYESGSWSAQSKEAMYKRAQDRMKAFALSRSNIDECRKAARSRFEDLFMSLGAKQVTVKFEDEK